jgi:hypothetical protein
MNPAAVSMHHDIEERHVGIYASVIEGTEWLDPWFLSYSPPHTRTHAHTHTHTHTHIYARTHTDTHTHTHTDTVTQTHTDCGTG